MGKGNESKEERAEKMRRERENEENETRTAKRRCDCFVSVEASEFFLSNGEIWRVLVIFPGETFWISLKRLVCS